MTTLIIVNPHAGGGRAGRLWNQVEPLLRQELGDLVVALTQHPAEVAGHLDQAIRQGLDKVIAVGGDGTNYVIVNALAALARDHPERLLPALGTLPIGTGHDWAHTMGIPSDTAEAVRWLAAARPVPVDIGCLTHEDQTVYFLNVASAGISGEIDARVNAIQNRHSWTFLTQTVRALLSYAPRPIQVYLDDQPWYEGTAFVAAVANGRSFGHGMLIAPESEVDDGLFDVVLAEGMGRVTALRALPSLYKGTHLLRSDVHHARAAEVRIESATGPIDLDLDGEYSSGQRLHFAIAPGLLHMLRPADPQPV